MRRYRHLHRQFCWITQNENIPRGRNGRGGGSGGGLTGLLKFLIFALVLAAVVLAVALTALRPAVSSAIMGIAEDNPTALRLPFVRDIVAENLGTALTAPASTDPSQVEFLVESGDTARSIANRLQAQGFLADSRAFVFIAIDRDLTGALKAGTFILRKNLTPDQLVTRGANTSLIHVDWMIGSNRIDVDGISAAGDSEPVMRAGEWV